MPVVNGHNGSTSRGMELSKSGWLDKYSVGRGLFPVKNWQRRYFTVTHGGLNYAKSPELHGDSRTYIPFVSQESVHEVRLNPVFLFEHITDTLHPAANEPNYAYFGIRFEEKGKAHVLLLRAPTVQERSLWTRFISQFVHVGALRGVPHLHPVDSASPRTFDPEELDPNEKRALRRAILEWDEGQDVRFSQGASSTENEEGSDDGRIDAAGHAGTAAAANGAPLASTPTTKMVVTPSASRAQTPRGALGQEDDDEEEDEDVGKRSGAQPSVRSYARPASVAIKTPTRPGLAELPTRVAEYDVL